MPFTVLISVYAKENPSWFHSAMQSIWDHQEAKPSEVVLVQDGPLTADLYAQIDHWRSKLGKKLVCVPIKTNVGLGKALNIGLEHCSHELVARMDTDDIAHPSRFAKQLHAFESIDIDVCGSWITEFDDDPSQITGARKLPESHSAIAQYAKRRCPVNHPSVMYKKSAVLAAGGYQHMLWFEDYYLWVRMLLNGAKFHNIQEPLVHMRAGMGQLERRSGLDYAKSEWQLLSRFKELGFISSAEFLQIASLRLPIRLLPKFLIRFIYRSLRT